MKWKASAGMIFAFFMVLPIRVRRNLFHEILKSLANKLKLLETMSLIEIDLKKILDDEFLHNLKATTSKNHSNQFLIDNKFLKFHKFIIYFATYKTLPPSQSLLSRSARDRWLCCKFAAWSADKKKHKNAV